MRDLDLALAAVARAARARAADREKPLELGRVSVTVAMANGRPGVAPHALYRRMGRNPLVTTS